MASSISPPTLPPPHSSFSSSTTSHKQVSFTNPRFLKHRCHSSSSSSDDSPPRWDSAIRNVVSNVARTFDRFINSSSSSLYSARRSNESDGGWGVEDRDDDDEVWDWDRWRQLFDRVDEQERIVSVLKLQLNHAVNREDYEGAARLKVAIAAAATNDTVGRVISMLNRAIEEERYKDASLIRDYAGAGLVGWWAGITEGTNDPFGRIIRITAEHGRYVARSYNPRQLTSATSGVPLFEIFLTIDKKGVYKQQAVHLKRKRASEDFKIISTISSIATTTATRGLNPIDSNDESDLLALNIEDIEDNDERDDDSDVVEGLSGFQNILRNMIPGVKVKVLKVSAPGKVSRDMISKVIEHIMDEEDDDDDDAEEKDFDLESLDTEDEEDAKDESNQRKQKIGMEAGEEIRDSEQEYGITVKFDEALVQKLTSSIPSKDLLRVPAKLEKKGRLSFSFSIEKDETKQDFSNKKQVSADKKGNLLGQRNADHTLFDLAKVIGTEKIPLKAIKDINEIIRFTLTQAQNNQPLTDSTTFKRLELPASPDPLNGFYIGAQGLYTSEVIQLRRKFGQWQGDGGTNESSSFEFYEYVEATKLTGDSYIPAGQVSFRAKVGKKYQLPHKGIIPEDFGVIARYKGQGRLPKPGFKNPRWVDGELVILDGKYIKGGPVVGFVYWDPEYHFLVFFNRLTLQE